MTSKYLVKFYFVTLMIGAVITTAISLVTEYDTVTKYLFQGQFGDFFGICISGRLRTINSNRQPGRFLHILIHPSIRHGDI